MQIHVTVAIDLFSHLLGLDEDDWEELWNSFYESGMADDQHVGATLELDDNGQVNMKFTRMH